jgi:hypothetical protein
LSFPEPDNCLLIGSVFIDVFRGRKYNKYGNSGFTVMEYFIP